MTGLDTAYATCESITRTQARNFHYGIRLLAPDKRSALCAVYALARRVDDIGDGSLPADEKLRQLDDLRSALANLDDAVDPVLVAVRDAAQRYPIPIEAFGELIDGVTLDVTAATYDSFDALVHYCRCVAGSIGRLCVGVFGVTDITTGPQLADTLGIALQQTNILRDIREDLINGRTYLPGEDLRRFGVELHLVDGVLADDGGALTALVRWSADRARKWYDDGFALLPLLDRRSAACCAAMAGIYRRLLERIAADPAIVFAGRISLSGREKSAVAARALLGRTA